MASRPDRFISIFRRKDVADEKDANEENEERENFKLKFKKLLSQSRPLTDLQKIPKQIFLNVAF